MTWTIVLIGTISFAWIISLYGAFTWDGIFMLLGIFAFSAILVTIAIAVKFRYIVMKGRSPRGMIRN